MDMMVFAKIKLDIQPSEFWKLTFAEWRPLYETIVGKQEKPMSVAEHRSIISDYEKQFTKQG